MISYTCTSLTPPLRLPPFLSRAHGHARVYVCVHVLVCMYTCMFVHMSKCSVGVGVGVGMGMGVGVSVWFDASV